MSLDRRTIQFDFDSSLADDAVWDSEIYFTYPEADSRAIDDECAAFGEDFSFTTHSF